MVRFEQLDPVPPKLAHKLANCTGEAKTSAPPQARTDKLRKTCQGPVKTQFMREPTTTLRRVQTQSESPPECGNITVEAAVPAQRKNHADTSTNITIFQDIKGYCYSRYSTLGRSGRRLLVGQILQGGGKTVEISARNAPISRPRGSREQIHVGVRAADEQHRPS